MPMMLAPLTLPDLDAPAASGGVGPGSSGVAQTINLWQWIANVMGNKFRFFTVNLGRSSAPEVEAGILQNVGSDGCRIGCISDAVERAFQIACSVMRSMTTTARRSAALPRRFARSSGSKRGR